MKSQLAVAHAPLIPGLPWHDLEEHLRSVGSLAAQRLGPAVDPTWGRLAGIWHDLGKYAGDWQDFIRSAGETATEAHVEEDGEQSRRRRGPDHSTAGAIHAIVRLGREVGLPLAFAISGHHGGMPDRESLRTRLAKEEKRRLYAASVGAATPEVDAAVGEVALPSWPAWFAGMALVDRARSLELFTRLVFSALVDADFLDTESYFAIAGQDRARSRVHEREKDWPSLFSYQAELDRHLDEKTRGAPDNTVNRLRRVVLSACRDAAPTTPGIFTLTVPTGGGKTLASLAFGLDHAARYGHKRVVVALPFTSIIEQTAQVFRGVFAAIGDDVVLEHHSALDPLRATARGRISSENWDAPLIVTTQVQLFESLFANRPAACRKLHSLIGSVLILDEVQSLPASLLEPILDVLDELARHYGATVVLTTATQPAFHRRILGGRVFRGLSTEPREIIPSEKRASLWDGLRRVAVRWPNQATPAPNEGPAFWTSFGQRVSTYDQVLVINHLKQDAQDLWQVVFGHDPTALHLSAAMCPEHRSQVLADVKRRLRAGLTCRLVTTQVVEAGVDIDFPVVFRAMAGLESLAQSAGRCNREGRLAQGELFVFRPPTQPPLALRLHQEVAEMMLGADADLDLSDPGVFRQYFDRLYAHKDCDLQGIQVLRKDLKFEETADKFRMIGEQTVAVFVPFAAGKQLIPRLHDGPSRDLLRRLQRYSVSVYPRQMESLKAEGAVEEIGNDSGFWSLCSDLHYHPQLGLRTKADPSVALII